MAPAACTDPLAGPESWDELRGVVHLVFLLHGLPGANRGEEFLTALAEREREDRVAGAVAAYG